MKYMKTKLVLHLKLPTSTYFKTLIIVLILYKNNAMTYTLERILLIKNMYV